MKFLSDTEQGDGGGQSSSFRGAECLCSLEMSGTGGCSFLWQCSVLCWANREPLAIGRCRECFHE